MTEESMAWHGSPAGAVADGLIAVACIMSAGMYHETPGMAAMLRNERISTRSGGG